MEKIEVVADEIFVDIAPRIFDNKMKFSSDYHNTENRQKQINEEQLPEIVKPKKQKLDIINIISTYKNQILIVIIIILIIVFLYILYNLIVKKNDDNLTPTIIQHPQEHLDSHLKVDNYDQYIINKSYSESVISDNISDLNEQILNNENLSKEISSEILNENDEIEFKNNIELNSISDIINESTDSSDSDEENDIINNKDSDFHETESQHDLLKSFSELNKKKMSKE